MGIRHLCPYIDEYNKHSSDRPTARVNNNIYTPKTLYIDLTSKVISFATQYLKQNEAFIEKHTLEEVLQNVVISLRSYLLNMLQKQSKYNRHINIFTDIITVAEDQTFIYNLFSDFIKNKKLGKEERVRSIVLIRRDDINRLMKFNDEYVKLQSEMFERTGKKSEEEYKGKDLEYFKNRLSKIEEKYFKMNFEEYINDVIKRSRYLHTYISISSMFDTTEDIRDYVNLHYVLEQYGVEIPGVISKEEADGKRFLRVSSYRDLMNGDKNKIKYDKFGCMVYDESEDRGSVRKDINKTPANGTDIKETVMYPYVNTDFDMIRLMFPMLLSKKVVEALEFIEDMVLKRYLLYVSAKFGVKQIRKHHKQTPKMPCVPTLLYMIGPLIEEIINTNKFNAEINIYGCEMEADFALLKHINVYNRRSFPVIDSPDTDMLCNLCDVPCLIHMKRIYPLKGDSKGPVKTKEYYINPVNFWKYVFGGTVIHKNVIKILCVLLGTDYNPYDKNSPIHIKSFEEILEKLGVNSYKEIDEDMLRLYVYNIMKEHPTDRHVIATALALNMYLNDNIESKLHNLYEELRTVRVDLKNPGAKRVIVRGRLLTEKMLDGEPVRVQRLFDNRHIEFERKVHLPGGLVFESKDEDKMERDEYVLEIHKKNHRARHVDPELVLVYSPDMNSPIIQFDDCIRGNSFWV